jgi:hypothetical protein
MVKGGWLRVKGERHFRFCGITGSWMVLLWTARASSGR